MSNLSGYAGSVSSDSIQIIKNVDQTADVVANVTAPDDSAFARGSVIIKLSSCYQVRRVIS